MSEEVKQVVQVTKGLPLSHRLLLILLALLGFGAMAYIIYIMFKKREVKK